MSVSETGRARERAVAAAAVAATLVLLAAAGTLALPARAEENQLDAEKAQRATLRGLKGVGLVVRCDSTVELEGLTKDQARADVQQWLEQGKVTVLTAEQCAQAQGSPRLCIDIAAATRRSATTAYALQLSVCLTQDVKLARDAEVTLSCPTWSTVKTEPTTKAELRGLATTRLRDLVYNFIYAYLAENTQE